mgnify:CR=1 FL=1
MEIKNYLKSPKRFNIEELIEFAIKELNIKHIKEIKLMYNDRLLDKLSKDIEFSALLYSPIINHYILYVREGIISQYVLCHELIHLQQYDRGDLKINEDFTKIYWKGEVFDNSIQYDQREWEIEAFSKQNKLWRKFKQMKRKQKRNEKSKD